MRRLFITACLVLLCACAHGKMPSLPNPSQGIFGTPALHQLLVVTDHAGLPEYERNLAAGAAIVMHHFAQQTSWKYVDDLTPEEVRAADAVVYFPTRSAMPEKGWQNLRYARRIVAFDQHLAQLQTLGFFPHVTGAREVRVPQNSRVRYGGQTFGLPGPVYTRFDATGGRALGSDVAEGTTPFAIVDGAATFVSVPLDFGATYLDPYAQGSELAACDVLRIALEAPAMPRIALVRFEDVSVEVPAENMRAIAEYMAGNGIPYGIGVIPNQLVKGSLPKPLSEDPGLVDALQFAQRNGARIVLHGFHHSYNSPEDFEFWDHVHNRPLQHDSVEWMTDRIEQGLAIERGVGLYPVMWESPHYAASPLDYRVVGEFFGLSWERRDPVDFQPWPLQQDQYGSSLLPENLGYVALQDQGDPHLLKWYTAEMQLARAKTFQVCGDCVPAGFLHPSTVPVDQVRGFVEGLQQLGYRFVDPLTVISLPDHRQFVR